MAALRPALAGFLAILLFGGSVPANAGEPSAKQLYKRGRKFEKLKDYANAYVMYSQAAAANPARKEYWQRAQALQRRAAAAVNVMPQSIDSAAPVAEPEEPVPAAAHEEIAEARRPQPPVELEAAPGTHTFNARADSRALWEQVMTRFGIEVIFDGDYEAGQPQRFRISEAGYREALHALSTATGSFIVPISPKLVMVVKDTEQKRKEVENTVAVAVPIPEPFSVQEAQELGRAVQQLMEIQRFAIDSAQRLAIFRDRVSKVRPAQLVFEQLLTGRAQIMIDVELSTVTRTSSRSLGMNLPTSFPITPLIRTITLGGGAASFALGIASANLIATATKSDSKTVYQAQMRAGDGLPSELHVGEKYPILTLGYFGNIGEGEQAFRPPPSFNFEDLGLVLKITPKIHDSKECTLDIEAEFKLLGGQSLNGIPVISNRSFATRARLRFDEAAIISGLITRNDIRSMTGPAGLINVPVLGTLLGQTNWSSDDIQLLLVMKPRLLSIPPTEVVTREIWVGSESRPRIPL